MKIEPGNRKTGLFLFCPMAVLTAPQPVRTKSNPVKYSHRAKMSYKRASKSEFKPRNDEDKS